MVDMFDEKSIAGKLTNIDLGSSSLPCPFGRSPNQQHQCDLSTTHGGKPWSKEKDDKRHLRSFQYTG
jgi:hypothetical protein